MITAALAYVAGSWWWAFLRRHWRVFVVLATVLFIYVTIHSWMERECLRREVQLRQEYDRQLRAAEAKNREIETHWRNLIHEADREHQQRLQAMEAKYQDAAARIGPVRLCPRPAGPTTVSRDSPSSGGDHETAGGDGLSGRAGARDIGPGLVKLAHTAETQTAQLIACQNYVRALETAR